MSFAERNNRKDVKFTSFREDTVKMGTVYKVTGLGTGNSKYGDYPYVDIIVAEEMYRLRLPSWMLDKINSIRNSELDMQDITSGKVGARFMEVEGKNGATHDIEWIDL